MALKLWQIVAAVVLGIAFGIVEPGRLTYAFGPATLYVFLPALLFEAAWNLNYRAMLRHWPAIAMLAVPGVLFTALVVAGALAIAGVPFGVGLLAGAILSATDPIAVVAIFRTLKVPKTLATIVESESLLNDAVAVALYRAVLAALALGLTARHAFTIGAVALQAILGSIGGIALGIAFAFVVAYALRRWLGGGVQIAATLLCAYGVYFVADQLQASGIFATIAFGIALRYYEDAWVTLRIAGAVDRFWSVVATLANWIVFFMVGAALEIGRVAREPVFVVACIVAIAIARVGVAGMLLPFNYPRPWLDVVRVAGTRGALSLALALALAQGTPYREAIVDATFAVALATLAASALTVKRVARRAARRATLAP